MCPHPPELGTPRHHGDEISFLGLIQLNVIENPFTLPRAPLIVNVSLSSSLIYQTTCSATVGIFKIISREVQKQKAVKTKLSIKSAVSFGEALGWPLPQLQESVVL